MKEKPMKLSIEIYKNNFKLYTITCPIMCGKGLNTVTHSLNYM